MWVYLSFYLKAYSDLTYDFGIKDQRNWYALSKKEGVYYSLGTSDQSQKKVVSYLGISPITHSSEVSLEQNFKESEEICDTLYEETGLGNKSFTEVSLSSLHGNLCSFEAKQADGDKVYVTRLYYLLNDAGNKYDYMISASYPKDSDVEKNKVDTLLSNIYFK